jgi:hypothetical protein
MGRATAGTKAAIAALVAGQDKELFQQLLKQLLQHYQPLRDGFLVDIIQQQLAT